MYDRAKISSREDGAAFAFEDVLEVVDTVDEADGEREDRVKDLVAVEGRRKGSVKRVWAVRRVGERGGMAGRLS